MMDITFFRDTYCFRFLSGF